jgi:insulin gene enhancer protein ISL-1
MGYGAMHGIPMTASSPMRHEASRGVTMRHDASHNNPVEVHSYEPPWKALCDFALHSDLERLNPNGQPYQNLVNQVFKSLNELLRQQLAVICLSFYSSFFIF